MNDLLVRCMSVLQGGNIAAWLVGGTVRDQLLGRESHDIDLVVSRDALSVARKLANALGGAYYPLDLERETGRVVLPDRSIIDVALLRGADIQTDLAARDFTINAMARSLLDSSQLVDPFGGEQDLKDGLLRAVSDPVFSVDPARLMRAVRLAAELGFAIEPQTVELLERDAHGIRLAAGERLREELLRMVCTQRASQELQTLSDTSLLVRLLPHASLDAGRKRIIDNLAKISEQYNLQRDQNALSQAGDEVGDLLTDYLPLLANDLDVDLDRGKAAACIIRLSALYADATAIVADFGSLRFRRDEIQYGRALVQHRGRVAALSYPPDGLSVHRFFRDTGAAQGRMGLLIFACAQNLGQPGEGQTLAIARTLFHNYTKAYDTVVAPKPLLNGAELAGRFKLRGAEIGRALTLLIEAQVSGLVDSIPAAEAYLSQRLNLKTEP